MEILIVIIGILFLNEKEAREKIELLEKIRARRNNIAKHGEFGKRF
jgi:hypothetical protein